MSFENRSFQLRDLRDPLGPCHGCSCSWEIPSRYIIHKGLLPKAVYWKVSTPNAASAVPVRQRHRSICFECSMTAFSSCSALQARIRVWEHCTRFSVKVASGASVSSWKRVWVNHLSSKAQTKNSRYEWWCIMRLRTSFAWRLSSIGSRDKPTDMEWR